jgi:hypothetical protein
MGRYRKAHNLVYKLVYTARYFIRYADSKGKVLYSRFEGSHHSHGPVRRLVTPRIAAVAVIVVLLPLLECPLPITGTVRNIPDHDDVELLPVTTAVAQLAQRWFLLWYVQIGLPAF